MKFHFSLIVFILIFSVCAFANILPSEATVNLDWAQFISGFLSNPQSVKGAGYGLLFVLVAVQFLKSSLFGKFFKSVPDQMQLAIITILGQVYAIAYKVIFIEDEVVSSVIIGALSSGGAASLFSGIKLLLPNLFKKNS